MKQKLSQSIQIPEGIVCEYQSGILKCKKDSLELSKKLSAPTIDVKIENNEIKVECKKGNKTDYKKIMTFLAHIKNIFHGLNEQFVYELEICNVHFPMSVKSEGDKISITNFLGEKEPRYAKILPNVEVKVSGNKITVSSPDREAAGQTAANLEKATKVRGRDRRIYQDGIFITKKPGRDE